jgi:hypothetical protein
VYSLSLSFLIPHLAVRPLWFIGSPSYLSVRLKISEYFCFCLLDYDTRQATQLAGGYGSAGESYYLYRQGGRLFTAAGGNLFFCNLSTTIQITRSDIPRHCSLLLNLMDLIVKSKAPYSLSV